MLSKIIEFAAIGGTVIDKVFLHRFLGNIIELIALTIISTMAVVLLLAGSFYGIYVWLGRYGLDSGIALLSTLGFGFLLTALLVGFTISRFRKARQVLPSAMPHHLFTQAGYIATAFLAGFKAL